LSPNSWHSKQEIRDQALLSEEKSGLESAGGAEFLHDGGYVATAGAGRHAEPARDPLVLET
jgi:hypothetical protein